MSDLLPTMIPAEELHKEVPGSEVHQNQDHVDIVEREKVDTDEVFIKPDLRSAKKKTAKPVILKVSDDEPNVSSAEPNVSSAEVKEETEVDLEEIIQPVKKPRKKRVVTEAQKAHLAKAREKALETRRRNKVLREEEEQANQSLNTKKQLARKKIRDEENKKLDAFIGTNDINSVPSNTNKSVSFQFTQGDLDKAVQNGIEQYEKVRKARKVEKQKQKAQEAKQQQVYSTITKAVGAHDWSFAFQ